MLIPAVLAALLPARAAELRVADVMSVGTAVTEVVPTGDGRWVGALEQGSGEIRILDTWTWSEVGITPCGSAGVGGLALYEGDDGTLRFYAGCGDGSLAWAEWDGAAWLGGDAPVALDSGPVRGLAVYDGVVYAVTDPADGEGNPEIHTYDIASEAVDGIDGFPSTLGLSGYADCAVAGSVLIVSTGGDRVSKVDLTTGNATQPTTVVGAADLTDVLTVPSSGRIFMAGGGSGVIEYQTGANLTSISIGTDDGLVDVTALGLDPDESLLTVADASLGELLLFGYDGGPSSVETDAAAFPEEGVGEVTEIAGLDGYAVAGTDGGDLWILTDRPWVEAGGPSPSSAVDGETVSLAFSSDTAGTWSVRLGAENDDDGTVLDSGEIEAGGTAEASFTVDDAFVEGDNLLRVVVEDAEGLTGHDVAALTVDNPPGQVVLDADSVGYGDALISLSFAGLEDADIDRYVVYLTVTPFLAEDWPEGGPDFDGDDPVDAPVEVPPGEPGATVSTTISPLTNGTTYYLAVRAVDAAGQEGPMSDVLSIRPLATSSAAELAGEEGGLCGTAPFGGLFALLGGLGAALRRRRSLLVLGLAAGIALPGRARAGEGAEVDVRKVEGHGTFGLRYGPVWLADDNINAVFNQGGHQVLWMEAGPTPLRQLEFTAGLGFFQELGFQLGEDGTQSAEHDMLTAWPVTATARVRLDFFDEQFLVPTAEAGGDAWLWRENWYVNPDVGGESAVSGAKYGWHYGAGLEVLLDRFEPARASWLQTRTGIDDSYFVVAWRGQQVGEFQQGLRFTGDSLSFGLRLDY